MAPMESKSIVSIQFQVLLLLAGRGGRKAKCTLVPLVAGVSLSTHLHEPDT